MLAGRRGWTRPLTDPVARAFAAAGFTPNQVTVLQAVLAVPVSFLLWKGPLGWAALAMAFVASLDFVDGAIARIKGTASLAGGYLDSLLDRFVDLLFVLPLLLRAGRPATWVAGSLFLFGMTVTSFARARVYQDIRPAADAWDGSLLERTERTILLILLVLAQGVADAMGRRVDLLFPGLAALAALSLVTVAQRMRTSWRLLREADRAP